MMAALKNWFVGLSSREQWLIGIAGGLAGLALLIFGIILPGLSAIDQAEITHDEAVQRRGRIEATVAAALMQKPVGRTVSGTDIDLIVTQGAAEKGFDLIKSTNGAPGQMTFRIEQARAPALFVWLTELEPQGVVVRSVTLRGGANGSLTVEAQLQRVAQ
jgi:general secretion pathway protein M